MSFEEGVDLARRPKEFSDYLFHRYANPSFLAAVGPLMLLDGLRSTEDAPGPLHLNRGRTIRVIDLACGAGHSSFLMGLLFPALTVFSVDQDFVSLYLAKRFLSPNSVHVCLDVEGASPFPDGYLDGVFCQDAFHYFHSKKAILAEMKRIAKPDALWLFPHLHNALQENITAGVSLSPETYLKCFNFLDVRLFDEAALVRDFTRNRVLDLSKAATLSELNESPTLTLMAGLPNLWSRHQGFPDLLRKRAKLFTINPIYRKRWVGEELELELAWPNEVLKTECAGVTEILPVHWKFKKSELSLLLNPTEATDSEKLNDLLAKFVLVALPKGYTTSG
jgi:SAM-dependent methyltransferase